MSQTHVHAMHVCVLCCSVCCAVCSVVCCALCSAVLCAVCARIARPSVFSGRLTSDMVHNCAAIRYFQEAHIAFAGAHSGVRGF